MLKKFLSAILSAVMVFTLFGGMFTTSAAGVKLDDELSAAKKLGFLTSSQESCIDKAATQTEVVKMISAAVQKRYGKTGKFLADRKSHAGSNAATRHYFASTLYFAVYEQIKSPKYSGYEDYMFSVIDSIGIMQDAETMGVRKDGSIGVMNLYYDCADIDEVRGDVPMPDKYKYLDDYGVDAPLIYLCALYDKVSGLPVMALDSKNNFNPQKEMTVGDAARATLRFYRGVDGEAKYVKLSKAGTYNKKIITKDLRNKKSSLPEASNQKLPVWRGILNTGMAFVKYQALGGRADKVIREGDIKAIADTGFNHMTLMISFPWLQGSEIKDGYVDKTRLEEVDRVIALCMKYDIHVTLTNVEMPGTSAWDKSARDNLTEKLSAPGMAKTYSRYWGMLAKRYKGIDNKYLAFNIMVEPEFLSEEQYEKLLGPSVKAIFDVDKSRVVIADIHNWGLTGEAMAKMGVALSYHHYEPRDFCALDETDYEWDKDYLQSVKWELSAKDTFDLHSDGDENIASLNDVREMADKYGVGFMVGEFGVFGKGYLSKYRYTDKTMKSYITSMVKAFEAEELGWVWGSLDGQWGILSSYPCVENADYVKLENSVNYYDKTLGAMFKKVTAVPNRPTNVKAVKSSDSKVVVSWNKVSGAKGYEVYKAASENGKYKLVKTLKGASKVKTTVSVAAGKPCYFKVRSYKTVDGKKVYSEYSDIASIASSAKEENDNPTAPVIAANTKPSDYSTKPVSFKTKIDKFNKQVKELPIPNEYKASYDYYTSNGYIYRKLDIDGIQLYEIRPEGDEPKPLVIQIHGGFWHKDPEGVQAWAEKGLCVVTIDVSCCGESQDGPLQGPAVWMETVKDIDVLIEYYNTIPGVDAKNFGLTGMSMGGNISELYTIYGKYKPTAICIECASADTTHEGSSWDCMSKGESGLTPIWEEEEMWRFTSAIAPINYPEYFKDVWMFICVGALDDTHSPEKMEEFKNKIEALGSDKIVFHRYKDFGHEVPPSWEENEKEQFFEKLLS